MKAEVLHPDAETLARFGRGELPEAELARLESHVANCTTCCNALGEVADDTLLMLARNAATPGPGADIPEPLRDHPRYRILSTIGAGGMGMVYKAEHRMMGRIVALKVIAPRYVANEQAIERFRREVRAAAALSHPNIVTAHDADEAGGLHFLAMEYVEGASLDRYVKRRGPMAVSTACHLIRQVALGLRHAHERGMVHRDIKPHNLMLTRKGQLKILDFGLARFVRQSEEEAFDDPGQFATAASMVMGTPDYLSPEQARNSKDIDGRSDLYSLGCTFYYLLTGRVLFASAETVMDKLIAHTREKPQSASKLRDDLPEGVLAILDRLLAKDPDHRFSSAEEVANALVPFTKATEKIDLAPTVPIEIDQLVDEIPAKPKRRKRKKTKAMIPVKPTLFGIASLAILLFAAWYLKKPKEDGLDGAISKGNPSIEKGIGINIGNNTGKPHVLMVLPQRNLWYRDYGPVRQELEKLGCRISTASREAGTCGLIQGSEGTPVIAERRVRDIDIQKIDAVVFCGHGQNEFAPSSPLGNDLQKLIQFMRSANKPVGGLCRGQLPLLAAGLLSGKSIPRSEYITPGEYNQASVSSTIDQKVVRYERVVVGKDDQAPAEFARELLAAIRGESN